MHIRPLIHGCFAGGAAALLLLGGCAAPAAPAPGAGQSSIAMEAASAARPDAQVLMGRQLVINRDCGGCHGGFSNPASEAWLKGATDVPEVPEGIPPRNLTPHDETGLGRFSERQIFNALRYGLRPATTPDVEITSAMPGEGNHPAEPDYLAPGMPWVYWRHMSDEELRAIAAYLKRGVRPVENHVPAGKHPPEGWAGALHVSKVGTHVLPPFPTDHEQEPPADRRQQVLRGRAVVASAACSGCHGRGISPASDGWLTGSLSEEQNFQIGPFKTRPRNLTPDNTTGLGRFSERQIFNSLRWGLRPGETPDVEITSATPGVGNHPLNPKYLAPPMPWTAWRHMPDADLWAIAAYLKHGVKPVRNRVEDSEGPPDFWMSEYTEEKYGAFPPRPFPTGKESVQRASSGGESGAAPLPR